MLKSTVGYGQRSRIGPRSVDQNIEDGELYRITTVSVLYPVSCVAREESKQQKGYAFPISWPPMPETYEPPETGSITDVELSLEVKELFQPDVYNAYDLRSCMPS